MKVAELEGEQLDEWVAKAANVPIKRYRDGFLYTDEPNFMSWDPSSSWLLGGPILAYMIESGEFYVRETGDGVMVSSDGAGSPPGEPPRTAMSPIRGEGPTLLVAAMRAYVASRFGEEVGAVPEAGG